MLVFTGPPAEGTEGTLPIEELIQTPEGQLAIGLIVVVVIVVIIAVAMLLKRRKK